MKSVLSAILAVIILSTTTSQACAADPVVAPPDQPYKGLTYGEWGEVWWIWANSMPVCESPLFDLTGELAGNNQFGDVWFLAGVFGLNTTWAMPIPVERRITVPEGKSLFFPILNNETNPCEWPWSIDDPPTVNEMYHFNAHGDNQLDATGVLDGISDLFAEIDGTSLGDTKQLRKYRGTAPEPFCFWLPPGAPEQILNPPDSISEDDRNLEQYWGVDVSGLICPVVSDGYWVMVKPLSVGQHTIHFGGRWGEFYMDITYHIEIVPAAE